MKEQKNYYRHFIYSILIVFIWLIFFQGVNNVNIEDEIIKIEKEALARWCNRDIWGFLGLFSDDATYFDNTTRNKIVGYESIKNYFLPWDGKIYTPNYKMANIHVQSDNNFGVLSYNLFNFNENGDTVMIWNSTEIYREIKGEWKIIHSHWSVAKK